MRTKVLMWIFIVISVISTTALVTMSVSRCNSHRNMSEKKGFCKNHKDRLLEKLNLTDEQKSLYDAEKLSHRERTRPFFDSILDTRKFMFEELKKDEPSQVVVDSCVSVIALYEGKMQNETAVHILNMKTFLNAVQVDSLFSFFTKKMIPCSKEFDKQCKRHRNCKKSSCKPN